MNRNGLNFLNATPLVGAAPVGAHRVPLARGSRTSLAGARSRGLGFSNTAENLRTRGPIIPIHVGLPSAMVGGIRSQGETPPPPEEIAALIDTGASITAIRNVVAQRLGLIQTGSVTVGGVTGTSQQPVYSAFLALPDMGVEFDPIQLAGTPSEFPGFDVLIGRNILCQMLLSYNGSKGIFSLESA